MSTTGKNIYAKKAKQKALMGTTTTASETKHDIKKTMVYTGKDLLIGGIGGGLAGAVTGRSSLLIGLVVTGAGHFFGSPTTAMFGVGMMASGGYQTVSSAMNGTEKTGVEGVKERFMNFQSNLKRQLFLDKIKLGKKKTDDTETTNGMGNVQYFKHPGNETSGIEGKVDHSELDKIEAQIQESAKQFTNQHTMHGDASETHTDDFEGVKESDIII